MQIRSDLVEAEVPLQRLAEFALVFNRNNHTNWSHLKNGEDFNAVYKLPDSQRLPLEQIYNTGRDLAVYMSDQLCAFNATERYSTLKRFVDSFDRGSLYRIDFLKNESRAAKDAYASLDNKPWAVGGMIQLYDEQILLLEDVVSTLAELRKTTLYTPGQGKKSPANRDFFSFLYDLATLILGDPSTRFSKALVLTGTMLISAPWWQAILQQALAKHLGLDTALLDRDDQKLFWSGLMFVGIGVSLYIWIKRSTTPKRDN